MLDSKSRAARFDAAYPYFPRMRELFRERANAILGGSIPEHPASTPRRVGVEIEISCLKRDGTPLNEITRNALVAEHAATQRWQKELGASMIELTSHPITLTGQQGFTALKEVIAAETMFLGRVLDTVGAVSIRLGCDPISFPDDRCRTTTEERYKMVPDFHWRHRRPGLPIMVGLDPGRLVRADAATIVGTMASVQFNLDCHSVAEAVELQNRSFVTGSYALALSANARYLDGVDTGFADVRGVLWEISHDIRTPGEVADGVAGRTGLPRAYYADIREYFVDVHDQPSIMNKPETAFALAIGLFWRDSRIKFLRMEGSEPQIVLEFRPVSLQPNPFDDYAVTAFSIGHLLGSAYLKTPLLPLPLVHDNRWSAMLDGTRGELWMVKEGTIRKHSARHVLSEQEIRVAEIGMGLLGANAAEIGEVTDWCLRRLTDGCPSDETARYFNGRTVSRTTLAAYIFRGKNL